MFVIKFIFIFGNIKMSYNKDDIVMLLDFFKIMILDLRNRVKI